MKNKFQGKESEPAKNQSPLPGPEPEIDARQQLIEQLAALPDFIAFVGNEADIQAPAHSLGRCHTARLYGSGSGRIPWSPTTKKTLAKSGWLPKGHEQSPRLYTVCFVGPCKICAAHKTAAGECPHPVGSYRITGDVIVDLDLLCAARHKQRVIPMDWAAFRRLDEQEKKTHYKSRAPWIKDGDGPVKLARTADEQLTLGVNEVARLRRLNRPVSLAELDRGLFGHVMDATGAVKRLRDKLSFRGESEE